MRCRVLPLVLAVFAIVATSCGGSSGGDAPAADRTVGEGSTFDTDQAILRTEVIEDGLEDGLTRGQATCMIDTATEAEGVELEDLRGIDLSATTGSGVSSSLAGVLADALVECGPDVVQRLHDEVPGSGAIPAVHAAEAECLTNQYVAGVRESYASRFAGRGEGEHEVDIVPILDGCDAAGALAVGASNAGVLDFFALNTLEWECLDVRLEPDDFLPAFPTPEEPGDALDRIGSSIAPDVAYCREFLAVGGGDLPDANG